MNAKQWASFFIVMISVNYVSATFLSIPKNRYRKCNGRLRGFLSKKVTLFKQSFRSKYGSQCSLGNRESEEYSLREVQAKGFSSFRLGDDCQCSYEDETAYVRFSLSFTEIVASFLLEIPEEAGGIFSRLFQLIFGIIGYFVDKVLQIAFPPFVCNVLVTGDYENGFSLSEFQIAKSSGKIGYLGRLSGYGRRFSRYDRLFFGPLEFVINAFLKTEFRPFFARGIGKWECNEQLFSEFGFSKGLVGGYGGGVTGGSESGGVTGGSEYGGSESGGSEYGGSKSGGSKSGGVTGGSESEGSEYGGSEYGGSEYGGSKSGGSKSGGSKSGGSKSGGSKSGGSKSGGGGGDDEECICRKRSRGGDSEEGQSEEQEEE